MAVKLKIKMRKKNLKLKQDRTIMQTIQKGKQNLCMKEDMVRGGKRKAFD